MLLDLRPPRTFISVAAGQTDVEQLQWNLLQHIIVRELKVGQKLASLLNECS